MNQVNLIGRLTSNPEVKYISISDGQQAHARYRLAVSRDYKNANGEYDADFITCECWGKRAEFVAKYLIKGMKVRVTGSIRTGSYENENGEKRYFTNVAVSEHEFVEGKMKYNGEADGNATLNSAKAKSGEELPNGFMAVDEDIPF